MTQDIKHKPVMDLKGGENSHLKARLRAAVDEKEEPLKKILYSEVYDRGAKVRKPGWTNIGDFSACMRTITALDTVYKNSETPHIAVASKHTRPVVLANGKTQLEAVVKAIAGDLNSPFGGVWALNTPLEQETAEFIDRMFIEGVIAPEYEKGTAELLKDTSKVKMHQNRFLLEVGYLKPEDLDVIVGKSLTPVAFGCYIEQDREPLFDALKECTVVTGNDGNSDINSLDSQLINDINFAGNVASYLSSNLIFYVHNGAIAGLGDGCGARTVAAEKARTMLEKSAYAAISADKEVKDYVWDAVLYDTPFTREDFDIIQTPIELTAFSDAFFPKLDGFVETSGVDRIKEEFGAREVVYTEKKKGKEYDVTFIPKKNNFDPDYNQSLIPKVVIQPGGSMADKLVRPMAENYGIKMVFTMPPEVGEKYLAGEKATGRRFFGHNIMS